MKGHVCCLIMVIKQWHNVQLCFFFFSPTVLVFVSLLIKCSTVISCVTFPGTIDLAVSLNYLILVPVFYTRLVVYMLACM